MQRCSTTIQDETTNLDKTNNTLNNDKCASNHPNTVIFEKKKEVSKGVVSVGDTKEQCWLGRREGIGWFDEEGRASVQNRSPVPMNQI